jgi:hypothetical protein
MAVDDVVKVPAGHGDAVPPSASLLPAGTDVQYQASGVELIVPAGQGEAELLPVLDTYSPAGAC